MKKILSMLIVFSTVFLCFAFPSAAEDPESMIFYYKNNVEVTVEMVEGLSYEQMQRIADHIAGEEIIIPGDQIMLNPQCAAGNHDLTATSATYYRHNVYPDSYKCIKEIYNIWICNRIGCEYINEQLVSSDRINTCHG